MTRSTLYILGIGAVVLGAVVMRARSSKPIVSPIASASQPADAPPRDFVREPWVAPGEERAGPARLVSLAPSITETICALGLRERLVARTQYCLYPPEIESVPVGGALTDANYEMIRALKPDFVFATENSAQAIQTLRAIGVRVEPVPHEHLEEVYAAIARIGDLCGRPRTARALIGSIWADIDRLRRSARAAAPSTRRVLMTLEMKVPPQELFVVGPGTFLDTMLGLAGYENVLSPVDSGYTTMPLEKVKQIDPDIILDFSTPRDPAEEAAMYAGWSRVGELTAIRSRRVVTVGGPEWLSAGPRIAIELHHFITRLGAVQIE